MNEVISVFTNVVKNNFLNFSGRARRKEYWLFQVGFLAIFIALMIVATILSFISTTLGSIVFGILGIAILGILIPSLALGFRRMQDVGKPGWFIFIPVYSLILAVTEGTHGDNEFGPDPKA